MVKRQLFLSIVASVLLIGCAVSQAPAPTARPYPTYTLYPTYTPYPTPTPTKRPTRTSRPTAAFSNELSEFPPEVCHASGYNPLRVLYVAVEAADLRDAPFLDDAPEVLLGEVEVNVVAVLPKGLPVCVYNVLVLGDDTWFEVTVKGIGGTNFIHGSVVGAKTQETAQYQAPVSKIPTFTPVPSRCVSWLDAGDHIGEYTCIEGTVVRTYNSGKAVFLNFHDPYQGYFSIVIWPEDWGKFSPPPEIKYRGKQVRVTGKIELYKGSPEIVVRNPEQIEIIP
jgi:hypothetical protein